MAPHPSMSSRIVENFNTFITGKNQNNTLNLVNYFENELNQNNNKLFIKEEQWKPNAILSNNKIHNINTKKKIINNKSIETKSIFNDYLKQKNQNFNNKKDMCITTFPLSALSPPSPTPLSRCIPTTSNLTCTESFLNLPKLQKTGSFSNYLKNSINLSLSSLSLSTQKKMNVYNPVTRLDRELSEIREAKVKVYF